MTLNYHQLDNPVWHSLNEVHQEFAITYEGMKFYNPSYCPFGGFINLESTASAINKYAESTESFYVVGKKPAFINPISLNNELICNQMVLEASIKLPITESIILLNNHYKQPLLNLVNLVQPGYFKEETTEMGSYYGIFKDNELVAAAGERMKMNHFIEVSAIVTHPDHTGKGYAKQLIKLVTEKIFAQQKTPYLHVAENNIGAIKLYEKLGFKTRRKISFWNLSYLK